MGSIVSHRQPITDPNIHSMPDTSKIDDAKNRARLKMAARREKRATYDLPPELRKSFQSLSEELRIPASQLVTLAMARFLKEYAEDGIDLGKYKKPSHSPRYDWILELPDSLIKIKKSRNL